MTDGQGAANRVVLTAVGADRPGIVAAVTAVLEELGCNLEDSSMSILRGQFAVLLVVAVPDGLDAGAVEEALAGAARQFELVVVVRPLPAAVPPVGEAAPPGGQAVAEGTVYAFSVHGADRPGIVHRVADALAGQGGNIVDLGTRLLGTAGAPTYVLTMTVGFDPGVDAAAAAEAVRTSVEAFGVQCHAHPVEIDVL